MSTVVPSIVVFFVNRYLSIGVDDWSAECAIIRVFRPEPHSVRFPNFVHIYWINKTEKLGLTTGFNK